ncbi:MAG: hypothetical protein AAF598_09100 [Bacteroidota bacterium]
MDELEKDLSAFYRKVKATDNTHLPTFEELLPTELEQGSLPQQKQRLVLLRPIALAASILLIAGLAFLAWPKSKPTLLDKEFVTQSLLPKSKSISEWKSPTQSLLNIQAIQQLKFEE